MLILKAYKFRLSPSFEQAVQLSQGAGCLRLVWNKALAIQKEKLDKNEKVHSYNELAGFLTQWKKSEALSFLALAPSQPLQQTLKDLDRALKDGFKKVKAMPRFKKKNQGHDGLRYPQGFNFEGRKIFIPKVGLIKTHMGRKVQGEMKNLTVRKEAGLWYASVQVEIEQEIGSHPRSNSIVGIDLGVKQFAALSNGQIIEPIAPYRAFAKRLAKEQKHLARKKKGSKNSSLSKQKIQTLHEKIRRIRHDYLHKASHWIAKNHGIVVLEDLKVSSMSRSAKGTLENPGRNVKAKSGLNKSILDQGWFEFRRQLEYKLQWSGGRLELVAPHYTSQTCSSCAHVSANNRKSQSQFSCEKCGFELNADENAARNIEQKALGHRVLACESNLIRGRKQELLRKRKVTKTISKSQSLVLTEESPS